MADLSTGRSPAPWTIGRPVFVWSLFGVMSMLAYWCAARFPLDQRGWLRRIPAHLAALAVISATHTVIYTLVTRLIQDGLLTTAGLGSWWIFAHLRGDSFLYGMMAGGYYLYAYVVRDRERERAAAGLRLQAAELDRELARARLRAFQSQLQPHFLFNALNSIATLVKTNEKEATRVLHALADLLRAVMATSERDSVRLSEELSLVRGYLDVEEARFSDRLRVRVLIAGDVGNPDIPPLLLQPLVENAVRHGIAGDPNAGLIEVSVTRDDGMLRVAVRDDGPGPATLVVEGIGLGSTRARLRQAYGEAASLTLTRTTPRGAIAEIAIPMRTGREG